MSAAQQATQSGSSYWAKFSTYALTFVEDIGLSAIMLRHTLVLILKGQINVGETLYHTDKLGIGSLPIVALSATFIGMAISVQFAKEIVTRYGADNLVGGFVAMSMFRELAPVFVAVVLSGNIGAAMTAELGTMKVTDQIDALKVFKIDPIGYLIVPRLVATLFVGPALTVLGTFLALLSGQLFSEFMVQIPAPVFWDSVKFTVTMRDVYNMLTKSFVFSMAIVMIAASIGLNTRGGSAAVGENTTRTVIWCLLAIFILNYIMTSIFFRFN